MLFPEISFGLHGFGFEHLSYRLAEVFSSGFLGGVVGIQDFEGLFVLKGFVFFISCFFLYFIRGSLFIVGGVGREIIIDSDVHGEGVGLVPPVDRLAPTFAHALLRHLLEIYH